ncbi:hypothetical protein U1Q18_026548 [Sarracenia purpurea var. burkii]
MDSLVFVDATGLMHWSLGRARCSGSLIYIPRTGFAGDHGSDSLASTGLVRQPLRLGQRCRGGKGLTRAPLFPLSPPLVRFCRQNHQGRSCSWDPVGEQDPRRDFRRLRDYRRTKWTSFPLYWVVGSLLLGSVPKDIKSNP